MFRKTTSAKLITWNYMEINKIWKSGIYNETSDSMGCQDNKAKRSCDVWKLSISGNEGKATFFISLEITF